MFTHIKTQEKKLSNAGSNQPPAHQVDDLALTRDTSYIELPE